MTSLRERFLEKLIGSAVFVCSKCGHSTYDTKCTNKDCHTPPTGWRNQEPWCSIEGSLYDVVDFDDYDIPTALRDIKGYVDSYVANLEKEARREEREERERIREIIGKHNAEILNEYQLQEMGDERQLFPVLEKATKITLSDTTGVGDKGKGHE